VAPGFRSAEQVIEVAPVWSRPRECTLEASPEGAEEEIQLPATRVGEEPAKWPVRAVSPIEVALRSRESPAGLESLFRGDEVLRTRLRSENWFIGRTADWTKHVVGSRQLWADLDILPLGLRRHPTYYAMGGLPGAPPGIHSDIRKLALGSGFRTRLIDPDVIDDARNLAVRLALNPSDRRLELTTFARALCLRASASAICGITLEPQVIVQVLEWFDRWSRILARQLALIALPPVPFGPARSLRGVLAEWYEFLRWALRQRDDREGGLISALRARLNSREISEEQAAGYLATILFAGTEPPSQTLVWGYTHAVAASPGGGWSEVDCEWAEQLLWESFRVQPAVSYLIRRISAGDGLYESASSDVFVVVPPLTHRLSNTERGLPLEFTPFLRTDGRLDPYAYPGLGTGAHYCIGARFGMAMIRDGLAFLLNETEPLGPWDATPVGRVMARPRQLPAPVMRS
jgi:cytochrome P450